MVPLWHPPAAVGRRRTAAAAIVILMAACTGEPSAAAPDAAAESPPASSAPTGAPLTVYSGRSEELVGPLFEQLRREEGLLLEVRYGDTAELAAQILEEGDNTPADVFFAQDAGALGALAAAGLLAELPEAAIGGIDQRFRSADGLWVGVSGRARVIAYNSAAVEAEQVPTSVLDLVDPGYSGRVGWAPSNGSFQAFVTAMRVDLGEGDARAWLEGMVANQTEVYEGNAAIVEAVGRGEIDFGLVNHYYRYQFLEEDPEFPVANAFPRGGDVGALVNVAGVGQLATSDQPQAALALIAELLAPASQDYFVEETFEYSLSGGGEGPPDAPPLADIETPPVDLSDLADLEGTLQLLQAVGALT